MEQQVEATEESGKPWGPSTPHLYRYKDADELADAAAKRFLDTAKRTVEKQDRCIVVLAGGSTPASLYKLLTEEPYRSKVPWSKLYFVFGDERCVPPDDERSNYRMARELLFDPLEISEFHVLRMKGEQVPKDAARRYEVRLSDLFLNQPKRHFDLTLLGIGTDGHTASLFPGSAGLEENENWVVANQIPETEEWRLSLTFKALNSSRRVIFMAAGEAKAQVVAEAFGGLEHEGTHPAELVRPVHARREILLDMEASKLVPKWAGKSDDK